MGATHCLPVRLPTCLASTPALLPNPLLSCRCAAGCARGYGPVDHEECHPCCGHAVVHALAPRSGHGASHLQRRLLLRAAVAGAAYQRAVWHAGASFPTMGCSDGLMGMLCLKTLGCCPLCWAWPGRHFACPATVATRKADASPLCHCCCGCGCCCCSHDPPASLLCALLGRTTCTCSWSPDRPAAC